MPSLCGRKRLVHGLLEQPWLDWSCHGAAVAVADGQRPQAVLAAVDEAQVDENRQRLLAGSRDRLGRRPDPTPSVRHARPRGVAPSLRRARGRSSRRRRCRARRARARAAGRAACVPARGERAGRSARVRRPAARSLPGDARPAGRSARPRAFPAVRVGRGSTPLLIVELVEQQHRVLDERAHEPAGAGAAGEIRRRRPSGRWRCPGSGGLGAADGIGEKQRQPPPVHVVVRLVLGVELPGDAGAEPQHAERGQRIDRVGERDAICPGPPVEVERRATGRARRPPRPARRAAPASSCAARARPPPGTTAGSPGRPARGARRSGRARSLRLRAGRRRGRAPASVTRLERCAVSAVTVSVPPSRSRRAAARCSRWRRTRASSGPPRSAAGARAARESPVAAPPRRRPPRRRGSREHLDREVRRVQPPVFGGIVVRAPSDGGTSRRRSRPSVDVACRLPLGSRRCEKARDNSRGGGRARPGAGGAARSCAASRPARRRSSSRASCNRSAA